MVLANELDLALHILYTVADNYPCDSCEFQNACIKVNPSRGCVIKKAFDAVHVEILRKEEDKAQ